MQQRVLGRTGVRVSTQCLGAMMFGPWGNDDREECERMILRALDAGINFIDTADVYSLGVSEEIVGRAIRGRRDQVVLATKVHGAMGPGANERGNSRRWIMREVEASLRRLDTDHIDLYQLHRPDPDTDLEESLDALTDLVRQGKIRYAGTSAFPAFHLVEAHRAAERRGLVRPACEQVSYSIMVRHAERDVFEVTRRLGMGVIVYSPLNAGWLTGKYRPEDRAPPGSRMERALRRRSPQLRRFDPELETTRRRFEIVDELRPVAEKAGVSLTHLAVAFTLAHPSVTSAIVGPRTPEQLDDLLAGADVRLDADTLDAIDAVVPPGTVVDESERGWDPPWMSPAARRRPV
jgi:aryl-alcohol dehydrogenase-like predicted oxidoreductase